MQKKYQKVNNGEVNKCRCSVNNAHTPHGIFPCHVNPQKTEHNIDVL
ncbi:hypothetical protein AB84_4740 [Escherichia coli 2-052-05_S3_C1]|nr:hypothetical protein AB84_4740 [Escherichia coli 2-052-05_S3_C1]KDV76560.1 hypothetical protein AC42_4898 [Escherichia coli 2-052-05_S3_C3]KEN80875.1 hypothetical protein AC14_4980 [Escherichia coli 2-052-05_S3_C2]